MNAANYARLSHYQKDVVTCATLQFRIVIIIAARTGPVCVCDVKPDTNKYK